MKRLLCVLLAVLIICSCWVTAGAAEDGTTAPEDKSGGWVFDSQYQLPTQTTEYTAGSGTITWEPTTVYDETHQCEKAASGRLTLNNASISVDATAEKGIWVPVDTELVLIGSNTITMSQSGTAIMITDPYFGGTPSLTIRGEGSLTVNANGGGDGMEVRNEINIVEGANVSISCSNGVGMFTTAGRINISDSTVKVRIADNASSRGAIRAVINGYPTADITIENSHVTAINPGGLSMKSSGSISFTDSDIAAIGTSSISNGYPSEGILAFAELSGGTINISGGTLYAQNNYENTDRYNYGFDLPYLPGKVTATDGAVICYHGSVYYLVQSGNNIQYESCAYDESTGAITVGNGYVMGNVEWKDSLLFPDSKSKKALYGRYYDVASQSNKVGTITIPAGTEAVIPASGYLFSYNLVNNGTLTAKGYCDNYGTLTNNGTINNYGFFYNEANTQFSGSGTFNNLYYAHNFPGSKTSDSMKINGLILNYDNTVSPVKWEYVAHGDAQLLYTNNQTVGANSSVFQPLYVLSDAIFTIPESRTVDASSAALGVTWETLSTYLSVQGKIVVNGTLKLPPDPVQEKLDELLTHITGTGQVIIGESTAYPVTVTGCTADKSFAVQGETVTLTPGVSAQGTRFLRWETSSGVTVGEDNTFTMPSGTVTVTAIYSHTVTFNTQGGSEVESQDVEGGQAAAEPAEAPTRDGYVFDNWYADAGGKTAYDFASEVTGPITLYAKWLKELPDPPAGEGGKQYKPVMGEGVSEVPKDLEDIYDAPAALETAMKVEITKKNGSIPQANTAVYDVTLLVSENGGTTWTPATEDNFPAGGLAVTLPYPSGTNSSYTFTVVHMFTTDFNNHHAGETESPKVTNTNSGIQFTVTGLSPIAVGWVKKNSGSGGGGWYPSVSYYDVKVEKAEHGTVTASPTSASSGSTVTLTVKPDEGYKLDKIAVTDSQGKAVELTEKDDKYTFKMPARNVTVQAGFVLEQTATPSPSPKPWENPFPDVKDSEWYIKAVEFVCTNGLMSGYANGRFGPNDTLTRAQFAQIIYNKEGRPATGGSRFSDVKDGMWYADAVNWAAAEGIVAGIGGGKFAPDRPITRQDLAVMLWRYAGSPKPRKNELDFVDSGKVSGYAWKALCWANENGVVNGKGNGLLDPRGNATRAEAAQMVMKYVNM